MFHPIGGPQEHNPCGLRKQHAQIAIAPFGDVPKDSPVARRHLFRHQSDPGCEIPPARKGRAVADRRNDCTGDDWSDPWYRHQLTAGLGALGNAFDLPGNTLDAFVEMAPVLDEVLNNADHPRGQHIIPLAENIRQGVTQPMQPLTDGDAVFKKETADLIDDCGAFTNEP